MLIMSINKKRSMSISSSRRIVRLSHTEYTNDYQIVDIYTDYPLTGNSIVHFFLTQSSVNMLIRCEKKFIVFPDKSETEVSD